MPGVTTQRDVTEGKVIRQPRPRREKSVQCLLRPEGCMGTLRPGQQWVGGGGEVNNEMRKSPLGKGRLLSRMDPGLERLAAPCEECGE